MVTIDDIFRGTMHSLSKQVADQMTEGHVLHSKPCDDCQLLPPAGPILPPAILHEQPGTHQRGRATDEAGHCFTQFNFFLFGFLVVVVVRSLTPPLNQPTPVINRIKLFYSEDGALSACILKKFSRKRTLFAEDKTL